MKKPTHAQMVKIARPMVERGDDWQATQWEVLNHFDGLTNSDEDGEAIMDAIRECEADIEEREWNRAPLHF